MLIAWADLDAEIQSVIATDVPFVYISFKDSLLVLAFIGVE